MWGAIEKTGVARPLLDEQSAGDLFAFFYAARFFEQPGDAGRGKRVFAERGCAKCHGLGAAAASGALPPGAWKSVGDPVEFAAAMWNHASRMQSENKNRWPQLSGQDLTDLLVFVRNSPEQRDVVSRFRMSGGAEGQKVFESKGCGNCHGQGKLDLSKRLRGLSLSGIAAQMWDHAPLMKTDPVHLDPTEMRNLLGYLWTRPFLQVRGNSAAGRRVFVAKSCASCHDGSAGGGIPIVPSADGMNGIDMMAVLWKHGPTMLQGMQAKGIAWPRFRDGEMTDLIAYLNTNYKPGDHK
jgi:mono/diheme cytochrome c family protein